MESSTNNYRLRFLGSGPEALPHRFLPTRTPVPGYRVYPGTWVIPTCLLLNNINRKILRVTVPRRKSRYYDVPGTRIPHYQCPFKILSLSFGYSQIASGYHFRLVSKLCSVFHGIFQLALHNVVLSPNYVAVRSKKTLSVSFRVERESGPPGCPNTRFLVCTYAYPLIPWYPGSCVSEVKQFIMICCALCYVSPKMIIKCSEGPGIQNVDLRCTKMKEKCLTTLCTISKLES